MADKNQIPTRISDRALEMVMRDVLDGMLELSLESAYSHRNIDFEIIEITPADRKGVSDRQQHERAEVLPFPALRRAVG